MNKRIITYPNQKIVHINKPDYKGNYLTVGIDDWIEASKTLKDNTFKVYLYLCSNADGFDLALSRQDVMNTLEVSKNSYARAVKELTEKNYVIPKTGNIYDFYTTPHTGISPLAGTVCTHTMVQDIPIEGDNMYPPEGTEISNINSINNLNKNANAERREENLLEDLEERELKELYFILDDYKKGKDFTYKNKKGFMAIKEKYNFNSMVTKETIETIKSVIHRREQLKAIENIVVPEYTSPAEYKPRTDKRKLSKEMEDLW